jgi:dihydrofolate synthase/folylpolyglutamate synthase
MSYREAIGFLFGLQKHGIKLGLDKTERILSLLKNPQRSFRAVHIAGTNGKGSVSAMIASILRAHGFSVGLFTSPHLVSFTERIRIGGEQISEREVIGLTDEIRALLDAHAEEVPHPTFFEFVTAMAFVYFSRMRVDWAVVEVGMGGRLDATNILAPEISVITRIGYDHKEFLGETLTEIAGEKAGIIKRGVPVVAAPQEQEAERVIVSTAGQRDAALSMYGREFSGELKSTGLEGTAFDYRDDAGTLQDLYTPLGGEHQVMNACVALKAAKVALERSATNARVRDELIRGGLASTRWSGRLEVMRRSPMIVIDGAHNPQAAEALAAFIARYLTDCRIILVAGVMSDKDVSGILSPLLPRASETIFTAPAYARAASPERLAEYAASQGFSSTVTASVKEAIEEAVRRAKGEKDLVLITGSFYTIGEARECLGEKAVLGTLRESL